MTDVRHPELLTDPFREVALALRKQADAVRTRNEGRIARLQEQIDATEQAAREAEAAYEALLATGEVADMLWPDGKREAAEQVRKEVKSDNATQAVYDNADLIDLEHRLKGSEWSIDGQPKRRDGKLRVTLVSSRVTRPRADVEAEVLEKIERAAETYRSRWESGSMGVTPVDVADLTVPDHMRLPFERGQGP